MASPKSSAVPPAASPPPSNSSVSNSSAPSVSPPSNSIAPLPAPPPSNSSAAPPPTSPPPSNASAPSPPPSNSSAASPPTSPPPSNASAATPLPSPTPSNSSAPTPPPSNSSSAPPPPQSPPPPASPPSSPPPPSKNSSTPTPAPTHPPPPKRIPSHPPPPRAHNSSTHHPPAAAQNVTPTANIFSSLNLTTGSVAVIGTFVGLLALALVILAVCLSRGRKKKKNNQENICKDISNTDHHNQISPSPFASHNSASSTFLRPQYSNASTASDVNISSRSWFTYEELSEATDGFSTDNLIGQGGFGCVYKGILNTDGRRVAVKRLKAGSGQGEREFRAEVEIISRIHHKHLVSLVGYCISENQRLLVYDFVSNNNLDYHLHDDSKPVMDWASRVKVASGAARGLAYLHEDCQPRIIHRDIKSTNILLDNNFEAKVADFGLAKIALELDLQTHVSTRVMGTFGYMAPEYAASGKLTEKSDVYSFGVVLLELITGRMPVDPSQPLGDESLVECARPLLAEALRTQDFDGLVDPRLESKFAEVEMFRMIEAAAACVRHSASKRPKMSQVARALDSMDELADLNNGIRPGQSGNFDSREHSARIRMFDQMAFGSKSDSVDFNSSQRSWRS